MQRRILKLLIAVVAAVGAVGISILLVGELGEFQVRLLVTGLCVAAGSAPAMACAVALDRGRAPAIARAGLTCSVAGFGMLALAVWIDALDWPYFRLAFTFVVLAVALAHVSVLALAELARRFRWACSVAATSSLALAGMILYAMWREGWDSEWYWRILGADAIAVAASSIVVAGCHRLTLSSARVRAHSPVEYCPSCGHRLGAQPGRVRCTACGARFDITRAD